MERAIPLLWRTMLAIGMFAALPGLVNMQKKAILSQTQDLVSKVGGIASPEKNADMAKAMKKAGIDACGGIDMAGMLPKLIGGGGVSGISGLAGIGGLAGESSEPAKPKPKAVPKTELTVMYHGDRGESDDDESEDFVVTRLPPGANVIFVDGKPQYYFPPSKTAAKK